MRNLFLAPNAQTRLLQVVGCDNESMLKAVSVYQGFAFVVIAVFRQAMADPADADIIRTVHRDSVPGQRAIRGGELAAARAGVGGAPLHLDVDCGVVASRQADSGERHVGEPLFRGANLEEPWGKA